MGCSLLVVRCVVIGVVIWIGQVLAVAATAQPSETHQVPAIYVFGDSTLDVGNNNYLPGEKVPRANVPFFGVDFPQSRPTGRFSNGYNIADFIAKAMGFKRSPPAYLSLTPRTSRQIMKGLRGVSYASAGAGILDSTNAGNNIPLSKQVLHFAATRAQMEAEVGPYVLGELLSKSFFLVGVGSNDLFKFAAAQAQNKSAATKSDVAKLYSNLVANYEATITALYKMGARKVAVINIGHVGCVPSVRLQSPTGACAESLNEVAVGFNRALQSLLVSLSAKLPGLSYSLADSYAMTAVTLANPSAAGFVNVDSACCGGGRLGAQSNCRSNSTLCGNRHQYLFWDSVHTTQHAAKLGASAFYDGPPQFTAPLSFKQLIQKRS